ncbi:MAG: TatD family hydrolase [Georgfuchsia sp.]
MLIDTHCHLDAKEFDADREVVIARAQAAGVSCIVVPTVGRANFATVTALCRQYSVCSAAYGIHPMYVDSAVPEDLEALRETLRCEQPIAMGEIGLDRFIVDRDDARQEFYFIEQLRIAREFNLPVLLHVRCAIDTVLKHLRQIRVHGGIAHAFNGSRQQADEFIKLGFKLGFGGAMTWPRATRLRKLAASLPLESIVLETDAPDIPPAWLGRKRNEPAEVAAIAREIAALRKMEVPALLTATMTNTKVVLQRMA